MSDQDDFYQALEQVQNIIDRQASNSFRIKGWSVSLIVVALLFRSSDYQIIVAFIPLIGFWYLDAYYLREERKYRRLYNRVRDDRGENLDLFDMNANRFDDNVEPIPVIMCSKSISIFHGVITAMLLGYGVILLCTNGGLSLG